MSDSLDTAWDLLALVLAPLRRHGAVRRYRAVGRDGSVRAVAALRGRRQEDRGELRVEVVPAGADATVEVRWTSPLRGRWWAEAVDVVGGGADPDAADLSVLDGVVNDVRRWAQGVARPTELTAVYSRPWVRKNQDAAFEQGMVWQ